MVYKIPKVGTWMHACFASWSDIIMSGLHRLDIFVLQLQLLAFNSELYDNLTEAMQFSYGVAIIAVFVEVRHYRAQYMGIVVSEH
jgi:hypothetical protein